MPWKERPGLGEIGSWSGCLEVFHLTHLDSLYLLSIYYVPGIAVGVGEIAVTGTGKVCGHGADILTGDTVTA